MQKRRELKNAESGNDEFSTSRQVRAEAVAFLEEGEGETYFVRYKYEKSSQ